MPGTTPSPGSRTTMIAIALTTIGIGFVIGVLFGARHLFWIVPAAVACLFVWVKHAGAEARNPEMAGWIFGLTLIALPVLGVVASVGWLGGYLLRRQILRRIESR
ncbi:hypothetical protein [Xanthomonas sp. 3307]|uniref:hypothetical protein n=1 Tax=Xanthomonas sp. 3307 TaxID=3035316 RepID=UPI00160D38A7|nr:hypothetical protein [Xanthomonas sp. 3307]MBB5942806.1 F0F1-type ATP synthase membrane subunit c/vacuolar-type H+-ATPase subunit K [Xanthomonas sp. 3307]